jgi:DNA-binding IclR family transcriptional regulator
VKETEPQIVSLRRGLDILRCFREGDGALSVIEIARRTGLAKPTASRLMHTLAGTGCLERRPEDGRYQLRPWSLTIGRRVLEGLAVREIARPALQRLAKAHHAAVALGAAHQIDMICLDYCVDPTAGTPRLSVGSVVPMGKTALGSAYLWALSPDRRAAMLERLAQAGERAAPDPAVIDKAFAELDEHGMCSSHNGWRRWTFALAAPLVFADGTVLALNCAVAQLGLNERRFRDECGPDLLGAVAEIRNAVGPVDADWLGVGAS